MKEQVLQNNSKGGSHKIIDCFIFNSEFDLLEIRLKYLSKYVSKFFIVEANQTFSGLIKEFNFEKHTIRFKEFLDQIVYIKVDFNNLNHKFNSAWERETYQRNCIKAEINKLDSSYIFILSDIDEIPDLSKLKYKNKLKLPIVFEQSLFYYYFNCKSEQRWQGSILFNLNNIRGIDIQELRDQRTKIKNVIKNGGWHFSYLSDIQGIVSKIRAFSHQELNTPEYLDREALWVYNHLVIDPFNRKYKYSIVSPRNEFKTEILKILKQFPQFFKEPLNNEEEFYKKVIIDKNELVVDQSIIIGENRLKFEEYQNKVELLTNDITLLREDNRLLVIENEELKKAIQNSRALKLSRAFKRIVRWDKSS